MNSIVGSIIFGIAGTLCFVLSAVLTIKKYKFLKNAVKVEGKVVEMHIEPARNADGDIWFPIIEFTTLNGETLKFQSPYGDEQHNEGTYKYKVGTTVNVLFDKANPQSAIIDNAGSKYLFPAILFVLSVGFFAAVLSANGVF